MGLGRIALCIAVLATAVACTCAQLPDLPFKCSSDADCLGSESCVQGFCAAKTSAGGGAGGGTAGGGTAGGGTAGGGAAGGSAGGAGGGVAGGAGGGGGGVAPCFPDGGEDLPDDNACDSNGDGIDGTAIGGVFVDSQMGSDANTGLTPAAPVRTVAAAFVVAQLSSAHSIFLTSTQHVVIGPLVWSHGASLYGGYTQGTWARVTTTRAQIEGSATGIRVTGSPDGGARVMDHVDLHAAAGAQPGEPSVGMELVSTRLAFNHVTVRARAGGDGLDAGMPSIAPGGAPGGDGGLGQIIAANSSPAPGGTSAGGCVAPGFNGGAGGKLVSAAPGGEPVSGMFLGGAGGTGAQSSCTDCNACTVMSTGQPGIDGTDGTVGDAGAAGAGGGGLGFIDAGTWVAASALGGGVGTNGTFGRGGGGGGAVVAPNFVLGGSAGGGGGAPGCPGSPGQRGGAGGASIGLVLFRSDITANDLRIETGPGGRGGNGGAGGAGGPGFPGGRGGAARTPGCLPDGGWVLDVLALPASPFQSGAGGNGGRGGNGGAGGPGGGGAGGPSVGIFCDGPTTSHVPLGVTIVGGSPGDGGVGAAPATDGTVGTAAPKLGCL